MLEMSKIGELKSGIKYLSSKNSLRVLMDYPVSELLVDTFYELDMTRPFILHLDGDITNSVLANLQRANFQEFVAHVSNLLKIEEDEVCVSISHMRCNLKGYLVSNYGRLYSLISNQFMAIQESEGSYSTVNLPYRDADRGAKVSTFPIHRLVYSSHHRVVIPEDMVIDHFDMNRQNNKLENLDLVTQQVNVQRARDAMREWRNLLQTGNFDREEADLEQRTKPREKWLPISYRYERNENAFRLPNYYHVSNLGRVKNTRTGRVLKQNVTFVGYKDVTIFSRKFSVHRMVAMTHVNNPDPATRVVVDHKDGNRQYNVANNLQWVTQQQNIEKALGIQVVAIPVDTQGNHGEPLIFPSATQACKHSFGQTRGAIPSSTMNSYLNSGKVLYGHIFRRMGGNTGDDSAGPGFDLQNRGMFVCSLDILRQEFEREEEEINNNSDNSNNSNNNISGSNDQDNGGGNNNSNGSNAQDDGNNNNDSSNAQDNNDNNNSSNVQEDSGNNSNQ